MQFGLWHVTQNACLQALLRCGELFQDLSDVDMEMNLTPMAEARSEVWQDSCQSKVSKCFPKNGGFNESRAGELLIQLKCHLVGPLCSKNAIEWYDSSFRSRGRIEIWYWVFPGQVLALNTFLEIGVLTF